MKKNRISILILLLCVFSIPSILAQDINFNDTWKFSNAERQGAENPSFDDSKWRNLPVPHDWAIEGPFDVKYNARSGGLPFHGTGWYRKNFATPKDAKGKVVRIEFEGAMYDAHIWINGQFVGNRPYGYIGFEFDISKFLKYDETDSSLDSSVFCFYRQCFCGSWSSFTTNTWLIMKY